MADILAKDFTVEDDFSLTRGLAHFNEDTGEWLRSTNVITFFERIGINLVEGKVETAVFNQAEDLSAQTTDPKRIFFKPDGLKVYISDITDVFEYDLSTAFDISTISFLQSFDLSTEDNDIAGLTFSNDGSKMYTCGGQNNNVYEYDLSTDYDISTSVFNQSFDISTQDTIPSGVQFNNDGSKMFLLGAANDSVYEYDLSTDYDISTAVISQTESISGISTLPQGFSFNESGSVMYVADSSSDDVYSFSLSTAFDISTISLLSTFDVSNEEATVRCVVVSNINNMYIVGTDDDELVQYDVSIVVEIPSIPTAVENDGNSGSFTNTKVATVEIGDWNMDTTSSTLINISGFADWENIISVYVIIRNDADSSHYPLNTTTSTSDALPVGGVGAISSGLGGTIRLVRTTGGFFDSTDFDSTSYNRGWLTVMYQDS